VSEKESVTVKLPIELIEFAQENKINLRIMLTAELLKRQRKLSKQKGVKNENNS
jgi:hypothetical protein